MQFMPQTAARYGLHDPHDPEQAIDAGARYFSDLLKKFEGRVDLALAAYNAGEGAITSFMTGKPLILRDGKIVNARGVITGGIPPYSETQKYVRYVLMRLNNKAIVPVARPAPKSPLDTRRVPTLDVYNLSQGLQKVSRTISSSFIEVSEYCPEF